MDIDVYAYLCYNVITLLSVWERPTPIGIKRKATMATTRFNPGRKTKATLRLVSVISGLLIVLVRGGDTVDERFQTSVLAVLVAVLVYCTLYASVEAYKRYRARKQRRTHQDVPIKHTRDWRRLKDPAATIDLGEAAEQYKGTNLY